jgi:hypothetical protein
MNSMLAGVLKNLTKNKRRGANVQTMYGMYCTTQTMKKI